MDNYTFISILRQRASGILLPLFSLPGPYGIGEMGQESYDFIRFLHEAGQSCWQILPMGPVSPIFGNSPYMSFSAFAGSPLLISIQLLVDQELLDLSEIPDTIFSPYQVAYPDVAAFKQTVLRRAWKRFSRQPQSQDTLRQFAQETPWVTDYGMFLALKSQYKQSPWYAWPDAIRKHDDEACLRVRQELSEEIDFHLFTQYLFMQQWQQLHKVSREHGIHIVGDLPIYVALDSVDVWSHQDIFQLDPVTGRPTHVAGVPPDYFSAQGQLWGNPLYAWDKTKVKERLWQWWEERLRHNFQMVDILRIDHFRGFEAYWSVPAEEKTAINGSWQPGPGEPFFTAMQKRLGDMPIIAEDLGVITPAVKQLRDHLQMPGMKILLFAFDGNPDNSYLPYNVEKNSVIYTGTHDNDTAVGWFLNPGVDTGAKKQAKQFARCFDQEAGSFHRDLIYLALSSASNLCMFPMQDVLGYGNDCRMNTPGTTTGNWQWRCPGGVLSDDLARWLGDQVRFFGRIPAIPTGKKDLPLDDHE